MNMRFRDDEVGGTRSEIKDTRQKERRTGIIIVVLPRRYFTETLLDMDVRVLNSVFHSVKLLVSLLLPTVSL